MGRTVEGPLRSASLPYPQLLYNGALPSGGTFGTTSWARAYAVITGIDVAFALNEPTHSNFFLAYNVATAPFWWGYVTATGDWYKSWRGELPMAQSQFIYSSWTANVAPQCLMWGYITTNPGINPLQ